MNNGSASVLHEMYEALDALKERNILDWVQLARRRVPGIDESAGACCIRHTSTHFSFVSYHPSDFAGVVGRFRPKWAIELCIGLYGVRGAVRSTFPLGMSSVAKDVGILTISFKYAALPNSFAIRTLRMAALANVALRRLVSGDTCGQIEGPWCLVDFGAGIHWYCAGASMSGKVRLDERSASLAMTSDMTCATTNPVNAHALQRNDCHRQRGNHARDRRPTAACTAKFKPLRSTLRA
eukprot:1972190-Pleurochrysis_carterae.AAC.3